MKRFEILLLGIAFLLLALPGASAQDDDNIPRLIAQGEGTVTVPADKVTIVLGVETRNESAAQAAAENALAMNQTIEALLDAGVSRDDIQTSRFTLSTLDSMDVIPYFEARAVEIANAAEVGEPAEDDTTPVFVATNQVIIQMNETGMVGEVLDAAIEAGTNTVEGVTFGLQDDSDATDMALTEAVEDARRKAEVMADAAGVNLSRIIEVSGGYSYTQSKSEASYDLAISSRQVTPVLSGDVEVTSSVTVTYQIK